MENVVVEAKKFGDRVLYRPVLVKTRVEFSEFQPLVYADGDVVVWFDTFEKAEVVALQRKNGLEDQEDILAAYWDYERGKWVATEHETCVRDSGREDFHADG